MKIKIIFITLVISIALPIGLMVFQGGKWDKYYKNKIYQPPREIVVNASDFFQTKGKSLDLGCGVGNETAYLLDNGWDVWALDCEPKAIQIMKERSDISSSNRLVTQVAKFEELNWQMLPQFDLICAANSLPFCKPQQFESVWASIKERIAPDGRFAGHFFGTNYSGFSSSEKSSMTFLTKEQLIKLLDGFDIEYFQEIEEDGTSGTGLKCHSHIFYVIAKKTTEGKSMDYKQLKIKSYKHWDLYLHENQCYLGRVFVQLKDEKGVEDFLDIQGEVRNEFFLIGDKLKNALKILFKPDKMNYAALSNTSPVIHMHIIPRYKETREFDGVIFKDARWGQNYAPYDRSFVLDEAMLFKIRDALQKQL